MIIIIIHHYYFYLEGKFLSRFVDALLHFPIDTMAQNLRLDPKHWTIITVTKIVSQDSRTIISQQLLPVKIHTMAQNLRLDPEHWTIIMATTIDGEIVSQRLLAVNNYCQ